MFQGCHGGVLSFCFFYYFYVHFYCYYGFFTQPAVWQTSLGSLGGPGTPQWVFGRNGKTLQLPQRNRIGKDDAFSSDLAVLEQWRFRSKTQIEPPNSTRQPGRLGIGYAAPYQV